ncbi:hypothetical protein [Streptomyces sp. enrichment culture]|uniref:hypothetical protein n=1 Tax=Streptomyces sp. enrichment culture TaxID=1795815 RepID=UPI003F55ABE1
MARVTSRMREKRIRRAGLAAGLALTLATVAGCSSDSGDNDEPINTGDESSASPDAEGGEAEDEAALVALYEAYWDAVIASENGEELDSALFEDITTKGVMEQELGRINTYKEQGVLREGAPVIENVTVTVEGDTARIEACKNEADWPLVQDGEQMEGVLPESLTVPHPNGVTAERSDGNWLITGSVPQEEAVISC